MVTRQSRAKGTGTRRRTGESARHAPIAEVRPVTVAKIRTRLDMASRRLQVAGTAARRLARSSMREVTGAVKASREPVTALFRTFRLAGRHILRDAAAAWHEVAPQHAAILKLPLLRGARRAG
jgi:hypothetical protein